MTTDSRKQRTCPECGGSDIIAGVGVSKTGEAGMIGLSFKSLIILRGTAPLYADLCRQCGTVVRFFVRETDKPWMTE